MGDPVMPEATDSKVKPSQISMPAAVPVPAPTSSPSLDLQGKYSIERLLALEEYTRTKSYWHVIWVLIRTPLVPLLAMIAYQFPPLAPPEAGVWANWMYVFERGGLGAVVAYEACMVIVRTLIPELIPVLPLRTRIGLNAVFSGTYVTMTIVLATVWGFPVPFTASLVNPTSGAAGLTALYLVARPITSQSHDLTRRFLMAIIYASMFSCASFGYPAYIGLFVYVGEHNSIYQAFVALLAPLIKFGLRKIMAYAVHEWEDLIPVMVIFSVEFFASLYQSISVQSSNSFLTTAVIIALDFTFAVSGQWKLYRSTKALQTLLEETDADALLPVVAHLCESPAFLQISSLHDSQELRSINVFGTFPNRQLSIETQQRLANIDQANVFTSAKWTRPSLSLSLANAQQSVKRSFVFQRVLCLRSVVAPSDIGRRESRDRSRKSSATIVAQDKQRIAIVEATSTLFRTEMMLLTEYLECIIPFFYTVNMVFVRFSPNASYYPLTGAIKTTPDLLLVLLNMSVLFVVEVASFVLLTLMLWKQLRFSPLHQVSYVMEHHTSLIWANMLFVLIVVLHLSVEHTGVDFSFQFNWLHTNGSSS